MNRTTTPTIILKVKNQNFDMSLIDICHVTIKSENGTKIKTYNNPTVDIENKRIMFTMSQEDTKNFYVGNIKIQIKAKLFGGTVISSKIVKTKLGEILEEEVI